MTQTTNNFEIRLTNVPNGAYNEDYLGQSRYCSTREEADKLVAQFERAKAARPDDFETESGAEMEAEIVEL